MNEEVLKMIDTLHARLNDVREAVETLTVEAPEYAQKLDKIDDKLYLLQCEIEKQASSALALVSEEEEAERVCAKNEGEASGVENDVQVTEAAKPSQETTDQTEASHESQGSAEGSEKKEKKEIFSEDMKENLADAGRAIGNIYRDGKEVITELSGTMGDLKDIFSFGKKR